MPPAQSILDRAGTILLDTARSDAENDGSYLFRAPIAVLETDRRDEVPDLLAELDRQRRRGRYVAGYLAYEAGYAFEARLTDLPERTSSENHPLLWFGVYEEREPVDADALFPTYEPQEEPASVAEAHLGLGEADYRDRIRSIEQAIREGEVYQINFTAPVRFRYDGAPLALYRSLRTRQPVPYGAVLATGHGWILSLSPELFFRREGSRIWTRPMKGTVARGATTEEDERQARALSEDPKSRAENLMIVDLLRNDLSRVCVPDSVKGTALFETEIHPTLIQMTSTVEGELQQEVQLAELFRALFPCGSVTGAPKIRAMRTIHELEPTPRGPYCGAIGYAGPGDEAVFSVAIRTVVLEGNRGVMGTGSGIVADSDPGAEYREALLKTDFLTRDHRPFRLIESLRWDDGYPLLERHLDRLGRSATYFGISLDRERVRARLREAARPLDPGEVYKVRLTLAPDGALTVSTDAVGSESGLLRLGLLEGAVRSNDRFRRHKTSRRRPLEDAYERARAEGYGDALLTNERGEITEATRWNLIARFGRSYLTPPPESGALPGVYLAALRSRTSRIRSAVLQPEDLERADHLYVCNAVRGLRRAELTGRL